MISYKRLWMKLEEEGISQYRLNREGISHNSLTSLKHDRNVNTDTLDKLCRILHCRIEDIVEYIEEPSQKD